ncbi:MAG: DUF2971 domain-containing protein [Bacilli bacterium]|jgi:hypothetical protein
MNDKISIINSTMYNKYSGPKTLFKYRPFDEYTYDMLENEYLFLCPAEKLDDKSECNTSFDLDRLIDLETNNLKRECVNQIIEMIRPYSTEENYQLIQSKISMIMNSNGTVKPNYMLELSLELEKLASGIDIASLVNWIVGIPEKLDDPTIRPQMEKLIGMALNSKKEIGICSLCECSDIDRMWENYYAGDDTGYCVEYDVSNYERNKEIFPVVYTNDRNTNIIVQLVGNFIGQMIYGFSNGQINPDRSQFIRLFLTKNTEWEYQREWRLIGVAGDKVKAPSIKAIYLGKNVLKEDEEKMREWCNNHSVNLMKKR